MDNRPIGFFDSGIGGLTSIPHVMKNLPQERIIFFGDTARTPYGSKSVDTIQHFSLQIAHFLKNHNVKMIVIACNTVSATCLDFLRRVYPDIPIVGVISPTAKVVSQRCGTSSRIGVIATAVTVKSRAYEQKIRSLRPDVQVYSMACPAFVPLIEEGIIDNEIMELTIKYYLDEFLHRHQITDLVLGCTHYPLIGEQIGRLYPQLNIISSSLEAANAVEIELRKRDMLASARSGNHVFVASDVSKAFLRMVEHISRGKKEIADIHFYNLDL